MLGALGCECAGFAPSLFYLVQPGRFIIRGPHVDLHGGKQEGQVRGPGWLVS